MPYLEAFQTNYWNEQWTKTKTNAEKNIAIKFTLILVRCLQKCLWIFQNVEDDFYCTRIIYVVIFWLSQSRLHFYVSTENIEYFFSFSFNFAIECDSKSLLRNVSISAILPAHIAIEKNFYVWAQQPEQRHQQKWWHLIRWMRFLHQDLLYLRMPNCNFATLHTSIDVRGDADAQQIAIQIYCLLQQLN